MDGLDGFSPLYRVCEIALSVVPGSKLDADRQVTIFGCYGEFSPMLAPAVALTFAADSINFTPWVSWI